MRSLLIILIILGFSSTSFSCESFSDKTLLEDTSGNMYITLKQQNLPKSIITDPTQFLVGENWWIYWIKESSNGIIIQPSDSRFIEINDKSIKTAGDLKEKYGDYISLCIGKPYL